MSNVFLRKRGKKVMEIRKIKCKSGNEYYIVNESWKTSNSWGHKSTLIAPWGEVESKKVRYYNRTWENYTYQTCMSDLLSTILENNLKSYITQYKEKNDISRLLADKKAEVIKEWEQKEYIHDLMEIKERIRDRRFD